MLAAKFFDDQYFNNAYYGKVGGVNGKEINSLEIEFLFMINFNLYVTDKEYEMYNRKLGEHASSIANETKYRQQVKMSSTQSIPTQRQF